MKVCPICNQEFENHHSYMGHVSGHSRHGLKVNYVTKKFNCIECKLNFKNGYQLRSHNIRIHHHSKKKSIEEKIQKYNDDFNIKFDLIKSFDYINQIPKIENDQWIYGHYTDNGILFYVGAGTIHRSFSLQDRNKKHKLIREKFGWTPGILAGPFIDRKEMFLKEVELIAKYHTYTRDPLSNKYATNFSIGGECTSRGTRWKYTSEQLEAHRQRMKKYYSNMPEEHRAKMRLIGKMSKGKKRNLTQEQIENIRQGAKKRPPRSDESKQKTSKTLLIKGLGKKLMSLYEKGTLWNN